MRSVIFCIDGVSSIKHLPITSNFRRWNTINKFTNVFMRRTTNVRLSVNIFGRV